jgi:hypothetical protein
MCQLALLGPTLTIAGLNRAESRIRSLVHGDYSDQDVIWLDFEWRKDVDIERASCGCFHHLGEGGDRGHQGQDQGIRRREGQSRRPSTIRATLMLFRKLRAYRLRRSRISLHSGLLSPDLSSWRTSKYPTTPCCLNLAGWDRHSHVSIALDTESVGE